MSDKQNNFSSSDARNVLAFGWGSLIGVLGGLIGLGGAEFRLPVLVSIFKYQTSHAIIINLIVSLVTVIFSLIFRVGLIGLDPIVTHSSIILNILAGSLIGSYIGVYFVTRINERALNRVVVIFLVCLSAVLIGHDFIFQNQGFQIPTVLRIILGAAAGVVIGVFSSMLGVAGGELIIPTIILLFSVDIKLAGSLSLAISIPTVVLGLVNYKIRQPCTDMVSKSTSFILCMSLGSILGALLGSRLLPYISGSVLHILLGFILLLSAIKLSTRKERRKAAE